MKFAAGWTDRRPTPPFHAAVGLLLLCMILVVTAGCRIASRPPWLRPASRGGIGMVAFEQIDSSCLRLVEEGKTPGLVLLIGRGNRALFRKAYGWRMKAPTRERMTPDTLFDLASLTKPTCTAAAVMLLVQDGRLALDAPVARYVPEFDTGDKRDITIAQLLAHTSGLQAYVSVASVEKEHGPGPNPDGLIRHIADLPKKYETGKGYTYSCLNYLALARAVRNVAGESMETFLQERLWKPLGMNDTTFRPTPEQITRTAPTIFNEGIFRRGIVHDPLAHYSIRPEYAPGNAGCFSTVDDLSRYVRMLLGGGRWKGREVFKAKSLAGMTMDQTGPLKAERTYGWAVTTSESYSTPLNREPGTCCLIHSGYTGNLIWIDKRSKTYFIFLSNTVYPADDPKRKQAVVEARRRMIRTLLDHLDAYRGLQPGASGSRP